MRVQLLRAAAACLLLRVVFQTVPSDAATVHIHAFDLNPSSGFDVSVNGASTRTVYSGPAGSLDATVSADSGDVVSIVPGGVDLQPPAPPLFTSLVGNGSGCALANWFPSGDPTVVGYDLSWGKASVASGDTPAYEQTIRLASVDSSDVCNLPQGKYYFAVQARNVGGMLSGYSTELSVNVVVVAVLISSFDASAGVDGVHLSWNVLSDEGLQGFRVYRTGPDGVQREVSPPGLIPVGESSFVDGSAVGGTSYSYVLGAVKDTGDEFRSVSVTVQTPPLALTLEQNVPNPFNDRTTISFVLDREAHVSLRIYDVRGARIATLVDGVLPRGRHTAVWTGRGGGGGIVPSGTYFCALVAGTRHMATKLLLIR